MNNDVFAPQFPATCPYITSIGATYLPPGASAFADEEVAVTSFPSGGGFSNIFNQSETPYQQSAVADYFAQDLVNYKYYESTDNSSFNANGGIYNRIGRGYPDFAAIGDNGKSTCKCFLIWRIVLTLPRIVIIYNGGVVTPIGGTSAAAPTFASILTRINEERLAANKTTVGFVNPLLVRLTPLCLRSRTRFLHQLSSGL